MFHLSERSRRSVLFFWHSTKAMLCFFSHLHCVASDFHLTSKFLVQSNSSSPIRPTTCCKYGVYFLFERNKWWNFNLWWIKCGRKRSQNYCQVFLVWGKWKFSYNFIEEKASSALTNIAFHFLDVCDALR